MDQAKHIEGVCEFKGIFPFRSVTTRMLEGTGLSSAFNEAPLKSLQSKTPHLTLRGPSDAMYHVHI